MTTAPQRNANQHGQSPVRDLTRVPEAQSQIAPGEHRHQCQFNEAFLGSPSLVWPAAEGREACERGCDRLRCDVALRVQFIRANKRSLPPPLAHLMFTGVLRQASLITGKVNLQPIKGGGRRGITGNYAPLPSDGTARHVLHPRTTRLPRQGLRRAYEAVDRQRRTDGRKKVNKSTSPSALA